MTEYLAPALFVFFWAFYSWLVERSKWRKRTLSYNMDFERLVWMKTMAAREIRMIDTNIVSGLQSGTAFFASTSLIAMGGAFTLLNSPDQFIMIADALPFMSETSISEFQFKTLGLMLLYAYAFLKFGWAYRLFNYASILIGAVAMPTEEIPEDEKNQRVEKASRMSVEAAKEFNRGQRAFFIAIGYLGWFLGDLYLLATTLAIYWMMASRQFFSPACKALNNKT